MFGMEIAEKKFKNYFSVNYMYMYCVQVITSKTMKDVHIFKKKTLKRTPYRMPSLHLM